ncbi:MAG: SusC/RagA family TonB-linked outer membrane protein, partial [Muribaculaceae bacterium]
MKKKGLSLSVKCRRFLAALLALTFAIGISAQKITVNGIVTDPANEPLIGASVLQKGSTKGTTTDFDGKFTLEVPSGATIVVSYVGYLTKEVAAKPNLTIVLDENQQVLDDVVVIGYGSVKRKDVTTAISSVSTKDIDRRPIVSAGEAIQGRAAGVSVVSPSGQPGGELSIRVRGTTSFNGSNDPLYVVDGVPVDNINFLSPNDIADMQILKDASSAAIYGSRAANGVVLITTKAGSKGDAKISFNAQYSINKVAKKIDVLNSAQYKELQDEIGLVNLPDDLPDLTDWHDETYTTGHTQNYQLAVSNGNDIMKYYISAGYQNEKGVLDVSYFKRFSFRTNVEGKIRKWLTVNANVSYSDYSSNGGGAMGTGANRGGTILSVVNTPTYAPVWDSLNPGQYYNNFYGVGNITNPRENMARAENDKAKENRLIASGSLLFTILPELTYKSTFSIDRRNAISTTFLDPISTAWGRENYGLGSDNRNMNTVLTFDNVVNYVKSFKDH